MNIFVNISSIIFGAGLIFIVILLMVRRKIVEAESILWILVGIVVAVLGSNTWVIMKLADFFGVWYPASIIFGAGIIGLFCIVFRGSIVISKQSDEINELAIQISLLNMETEQMRKKLQELETQVPETKM